MSLHNPNFLITFTPVYLPQQNRPGFAEQQNTTHIMDPDRVQPAEKFFTTFYKALLCLSLIVSLFSCGKKDAWIEVDPAFSQYIDAYTTGVISKTSTISIQLAADANTTHTVGEELKEKLFDFSPSIKGKAYWLNARTIEFKPDSWLAPDKVYEVNFKLGKVTKVPDKFSNLRFNMKTVKPSFKVTENGLRSNGTKNKMSLGGQLETADVEKGKELEQLLTAVQNSRPLKINWQHNDAAKAHIFTIENIERGSAATNISLNWNGKSMGMDVQGETSIAVPAAGDFKVLNVMAMNEAQQYASVQFSDPIAIGQDLAGLITMSNQQDISYTINGSEVKVFTNGKLDGNYTVNINSGIKNSWGDLLNKGFTSNINFENKLPAVKIHGKGNILPNGNGIAELHGGILLGLVHGRYIQYFKIAGSGHGDTGFALYIHAH